MENWTVLDTETTGFSHEDDRLVEFAASRFNPETGELLEQRLHLLINPQRPIPPDVSKIHGIDDELVKDKPVFTEIAEQVLAFAEGSTLVIQNAPFDIRFLNAELKRAKKTPLDDVVKQVICTRRLSNLVRPGQPASLDKLCDLFSVDRTKRTQHGALIDCELLAKVYPHLARLAEELDRKVEKILPFRRNQELPQDIRELGNAHVALATIIKTLEMEQKRIETEVRKLTNGTSFTDRDFTVTYTGSGVTTDYKGALLKNYPDFDIKPYQKPAEQRMSIKPT